MLHGGYGLRLRAWSQMRDQFNLIGTLHPDLLQCVLIAAGPKATACAAGTCKHLHTQCASAVVWAAHVEKLHALADDIGFDSETMLDPSESVCQHFQSLLKEYVFIEDAYLEDGFADAQAWLEQW